MTADDSTPTRLADALLEDKWSRYLGSQSYRHINQADLRTLAQQAYLAGKHDGWDEGYDRGVRDEVSDLERADNPYPVDGAAQ